MSTRRDAVPTLYPRQRNREAAAGHLDLRAVAFFSAALILIALAGSLYLQQASQVAAYAHDIRELERHKENLRREITALEADVATAGAIGRLVATAQQRGYVLPAIGDTARRAVIGVAPGTATLPTVRAGEAEEPAVPLLLDEPDGLVDRLISELSAWLSGEPIVGAD